MFSDAHMNGKFLCKIEAGMYIVLRMLQHFLYLRSKLHILNLLENNAVSLLYPVLECDYYRVVRQRAIILILIGPEKITLSSHINNILIVSPREK